MESKGLVGHFKSAFNSTVNAVSASLVNVFVFFALGAAVLSIWESVLAKGGSDLNFYKLLFLGLAAILAELLGLKEMIKAWWEAAPVKTLAWAGIWAVGFCFSLYGAMFSAGTFQAKREGIQKAAYQKEQNAEDQLKTAKDEQKRIQGRLGWMETAVNGKPVRTIEAAQTDIDNLKAQRLWESTDACTDVKGKTTKEFCDRYAALITEKSLAGEKLTAIEDLKKAKADVARYEQMISTRTTATVSEATPFVQVMVDMGVDAHKAALIEPMQASISNMLLVSLAGLVLGLQAIQGKARTPWVDWLRIKRAIMGGTPATETALRELAKKTDAYVANRDVNGILQLAKVHQVPA
jgi:ubiquitin